MTASKRAFRDGHTIPKAEKLNVGDSVNPAFDSNIERNVFQQPANRLAVWRASAVVNDGAMLTARDLHPILWTHFQDDSSVMRALALC